VTAWARLSIVRRRWRAVLLLSLVSVLGGGVYLSAAPVVYSATSSAFFSLTSGSSASELVQGSTYAQNQVDSFARLASTPVVLEPVVAELGLDVEPTALAHRIQAAVPVGTVIVEVTASDSTAEGSAALADAVVASLAVVVEKLAPTDDGGRPTVRSTTVAEAEIPGEPASPNVPLVLAAALLAGLILGGGLALLREVLDTRVRDAEVLAQVTPTPLIGTVGIWPASESSRVFVATAPHSPAAESVRQLRTNLQFIRVAEQPATDVRRGAHVVSVTSAMAAEGKSTVSINLAVSLAQTGARVLLVDADLRRPTVAEVLGVEGGVGLTTVLAGDAALGDVVQEWGSAGLEVLPSGAVPPNPTELLGSPAMRGLVGQMRAAYDYVVVDTAPLLPVADAAVLAGLVDGTVVVAHAGRVRRAQLSQALGNLERVSARILGVVLNQVRRDEESYSYRQREAATEVSAAAGKRERSDAPRRLPAGRPSAGS
jgi:polysaccharide biosynthesis transport protein